MNVQYNRESNHRKQKAEIETTGYKYEISVVVPCFNEEGNIPTLVEKIQHVFSSYSIPGEIILVNDASRDGTQKQIEIAEKKNSNIQSLQHKINKGIFEAWITGVHNASGRYVVIIDADMQYDPEDIYTLYREKEKNKIDIIQGWRKNYHDSYLRFVLKAGFGKLLQIVFNYNMEDIKSGFILCKKEIFTDILTYRLGYKYPQHYLILSAISKHYTVKQIPITFNRRKEGESFIKNPIFFSLGSLFELPKAFYEFRLLKHGTVRRPQGKCAE